MQQINEYRLSEMLRAAGVVIYIIAFIGNSRQEVLPSAVNNVKSLVCRIVGNKTTAYRH